MTQITENAPTVQTTIPWFIEVDKNGKIVSIFEHQPTKQTLQHTHFKDKLEFLSSLGYVFKESGIPTLESILKTGLKPAGVVIEHEGSYYQFTEDVLQNATSLEILNGTAYLNLVCHSRLQFVENGTNVATVEAPTAFSVDLFINQFVLISILVSKGVALSLDNTVLK